MLYGNVRIILSIPNDLLQQVNENIKGKDQNEKLRKCIERGYFEITKKRLAEPATASSSTGSETATIPPPPSPISKKT